MSNHNICFHKEIRNLLSGAMFGDTFFARSCDLPMMNYMYVIT